MTIRHWCLEEPDIFDHPTVVLRKGERKGTCNPVTICGYHCCSLLSLLYESSFGNVRFTDTHTIKALLIFTNRLLFRRSHHGYQYTTPTTDLQDITYVQSLHCLLVWMLLCDCLSRSASAKPKSSRQQNCVQRALWCIEFAAYIPLCQRCLKRKQAGTTAAYTFMRKIQRRLYFTMYISNNTTAERSQILLHIRCDLKAEYTLIVMMLQKQRSVNCEQVCWAQTCMWHTNRN